MSTFIEFTIGSSSVEIACHPFLFSSNSDDRIIHRVIRNITYFSVPSFWSMSGLSEQFIFPKSRQTCVCAL